MVAFQDDVEDGTNGGGARNRSHRKSFDSLCTTTGPVGVTGPVTPRDEGLTGPGTLASRDEGLTGPGTLASRDGGLTGPGTLPNRDEGLTGPGTPAN